MNAVCSLFKLSYNQYSIWFDINYIVIFGSMNWSSLTYKPFKLFANADKNIEMNFSLNIKSSIFSFEPGFCRDNFRFAKDVGIIWFFPPLPLGGVDFVIHTVSFVSWVEKVFGPKPRFLSIYPGLEPGTSWWQHDTEMIFFRSQVRYPITPADPVDDHIQKSVDISTCFKFLIPSIANLKSNVEFTFLLINLFIVLFPSMLFSCEELLGGASWESTSNSYLRSNKMYFYFCAVYFVEWLICIFVNFVVLYTLYPSYRFVDPDSWNCKTCCRCRALHFCLSFLRIISVVSVGLPVRVSVLDLDGPNSGLRTRDNIHVCPLLCPLNQIRNWGSPSEWYLCMSTVLPTQPHKILCGWVGTVDVHG